MLSTLTKLIVESTNKQHAVDHVMSELKKVLHPNQSIEHMNLLVHQLSIKLTEYHLKHNSPDFVIVESLETIDALQSYVLTQYALEVTFIDQPQSSVM